MDELSQMLLITRVSTPTVDDDAASSMGPGIKTSTNVIKILERNSLDSYNTKILKN